MSAGPVLNPEMDSPLRCPRLLGRAVARERRAARMAVRQVDARELRLDVDVTRGGEAMARCRDLLPSIAVTFPVCPTPVRAQGRRGGRSGLGRRRRPARRLSCKRWQLPMSSRSEKGSGSEPDGPILDSSRYIAAACARGHWNRTAGRRRHRRVTTLAALPLARQLSPSPGPCDATRGRAQGTSRRSN